jgi:hypothetical protein
MSADGLSPNGTPVDQGRSGATHVGDEVTNNPDGSVTIEGVKFFIASFLDSHFQPIMQGSTLTMDNGSLKLVLPGPLPSDLSYPVYLTIDNDSADDTDGGPDATSDIEEPVGAVDFSDSGTDEQTDSAPNPVPPPGSCRVTAYPDPYVDGVGVLHAHGTNYCDSSRIVYMSLTVCAQTKHSFLGYTFWHNITCQGDYAYGPAFLEDEATHVCNPDHYITWRTYVHGFVEYSNGSEGEAHLRSYEKKLHC